LVPQTLLFIPLADIIAISASATRHGIDPDLSTFLIRSARG